MHRVYLSLLIILFGGLAYATGGPSDFISYQGRLTDSGTFADGDYEFQFDLWTIASTGLLVDSSTQTLTVTNGLFNAELPFADEFDRVDFFTNPIDFELEIGVRPAGSMDPFTVLSRQQLRNAPRAQIAERGSDTFLVGDADGGRINVTDGAGERTFTIEPDVDGDGPFMALEGRDGSVFIDSTFTSIGPRMSMTSPLGGIIFAPGDAVENDRVILPTGSIGSAEIGDEAGVASSSFVPFSTFLPTTYAPVLTRSITCPADGFVIVNGMIGLGTFGADQVAANQAAISIDGSTPYNGFAHGTFINTGANASMTIAVSSPLAQVIPVVAGQTLDVSIIAQTDNAAAAYYTGPLQLTLEFVPTSYGAVSRGVNAPASGAGMGAPAPGTVFTPAAMDRSVSGPDPKVAALEAQVERILAELAEIRAQQDAANGR